jgi:hypothetical protein
LFVQERKINEELKKLLPLEKGKVEKLDQELAKSKETTYVIPSFCAKTKYSSYA